MAFHPYLFFGGNCREAFTRYQEIFGGELVLLTSADMPSEEQMPGASPESIMHAALMTEGGLLMASDDTASDPFGPVQGMFVNHTVADIDDAKRAFEALAEGGQVNTPFGPTSWSPGFGMCVDRFGTPWMVNVEDPEAASG